MKRFAVLVFKGLGWLALTLATIALAWLAFNNRWVDAAQQPVPEPLRMAPATVPAQRNIFFALIGINDADPMAAGQAQWANLQQGGKDEANPTVWGISAPWACGPKTENCVEQWTGQADAVGAQLQADAARGERCAALAAPDLDFEELTPEPSAGLAANAHISPHTVSAGRCVRWLLASAVVAAHRGRDDDSLRRLLQADRLLRLQLAGSRTLISHAVAWSAARLQWQTVATLFARHPGWAARHSEPLGALLRPLPPQALSAARWIAIQSGFERKVLAALIPGNCMASLPGGASSADAGAWVCMMDKSYMPQATQREFDQRWLGVLAQSELNARQSPLSPRFTQPAAEGMWQWRNTVGHIMFFVAQGQWIGYARKQADVELFRQTAFLAVSLAAQLPAARTTWLNSQPIDAALRKRIHLSDDNTQLLARSWQDAPDVPDFRIPLAPLRDQHHAAP